jgi:hypothetical protein
VKDKGFVFVVGMIGALFLRLLIILTLPPASDVYYYDLQAARAILTGQSPYAYHFFNVPSELMTAGAESVFAYLPIAAMYQVPFYLLGDVRFGFILADLVIGASIYFFRQKLSLILSLLYLFLPFTILLSTIFLNNSLISMLFVALSLLLEKRGKGMAAAIFFGVALATTQLSWLIFPLLISYYLRSERWKESITILLVPLTIILPFLLITPSEFIKDTIEFQFSRPIPYLMDTGSANYNLNLSLNGILLTLFHFTLPAYARLISTIAIALSLVIRVNNYKNFILLSSVFMLLATFILPNVFFWAYIEFPFLLFLTFVSLSNSKELMLKTWLKKMGREAIGGDKRTTKA